MPDVMGTSDSSLKGIASSSGTERYLMQARNKYWLDRGARMSDPSEPRPFSLSAFCRKSITV